MILAVIIAMKVVYTTAHATYLRIVFVDSLNGRLYISRMNGMSDLNPSCDRGNVWHRLHVRFLGKFTGRFWVAMADEVIHDDVVEVAEMSSD